MLMPKKQALLSIFVQKKMKETKAGLSRDHPQKGRLSSINSKILEAQARINIVK